jgi:hypothetical protein
MGLNGKVGTMGKDTKVRLELTKAEWTELYRVLFVTYNGELEELDWFRKILAEKLHAMEMRDAYTKYATAPEGAGREKLRKEYLDKRGVPEDFRWGFKDKK